MQVVNVSIGEIGVRSVYLVRAKVATEITGAVESQIQVAHKIAGKFDMPREV